MEKAIGIVEKKIRDASWEDVKNVFDTFRHLVATLKQDKENILYLIEDKFEIPMGQFEYSMDIYKDNNFYCIVQEHTTTSGNKLHFILRAFLSQPVRRKLVLYEMIAEMASNVSRNCDRTLCDVTSGICATIEYYARQLKDLGNLPIARIEQAIQEGLARRSAENWTGKLDHRRLLTV